MLPKTSTTSRANRKTRGSGHERRGEILAAARALFLAHGFENVSTRRIAEQVGISQTALFAYYKTKDDIFALLLEEAFAALDATLTEIDRIAIDMRDWLRRAVAGYVRFGLEHPDAYRLAFMVMKAYHRPYNVDAVEASGEGARAGSGVFFRLVAKIEEAIAANIVRADLGPPLLVAQIFWTSMHGLVAALIARPKPHFPWEAVDALIAAETAILLRGMAGPESD